MALEQRLKGEIRVNYANISQKSVSHKEISSASQGPYGIIPGMLENSKEIVPCH